MFKLFRYARKILFLLVFGFFCLCGYGTAYAEIAAVGDENGGSFPFDLLKVNVWQDVEKGVQFLRLSQTIMVDRGDGANQKLPLSVQFDVLKFDPEFFSFSVYSASIDNTEKKSLQEWTGEYGLKAGINASMYLPDEKTSIGYLRKDTRINNRHKGKKLGAYFVSEPYGKYRGTIPECAILYTDDPDLPKFFQKNEPDKTLENALKKYKIVVQNFRIYELEEKQSSWKGQRRHSIAAIAQDRAGRILLMYASNPITVEEFRTILQNNSLLNIKRAMYVEGGSEACMAYRKDTLFLWQHNDNIMFLLKGIIRLPNIIGVKKRL